YSVSKTVTALAVGIAAEEGLLQPDDLLVDHLPAPQGGYGRGVGRVTLRHLLTMTSGSPVLGFLDEEREHGDLAALVLGTDLTAAPGERWEYSNASIFLLSRVLTERTGRTMRDWLMPRLFEPLGILNPQWHTTRDCHSWGATGLHLKSGQLARIGRLLLQRGAHEGAQLVPAPWVDALHAESSWVATGDPEPESTRYGLGGGAHRRDGAGPEAVRVRGAGRRDRRRGRRLRVRRLDLRALAGAGTRGSRRAAGGGRHRGPDPADARDRLPLARARRDG